MKKLFLATYLFCLAFTGYAQQIDSPQNPTLPKPDLRLKSSKTKNWPNPNKALLFSIIPGGGQIYNKRWWKVPIVYAAVGTGVYVAQYNRGIYLRFNEALNLSRAGLPHEFSEIGFSTTTLKIKRDLANRYLQQAYLATFVIYLLQSTEAFVDAHLRNFDMNEDLSFKLQPNMDYISELSQPVVGLSFSIPISR